MQQLDVDVRGTTNHDIGDQRGGLRKTNLIIVVPVGNSEESLAEDDL
jgi:hypothetical protein